MGKWKGKLANYLFFIENEPATLKKVQELVGADGMGYIQAAIASAAELIADGEIDKMQWHIDGHSITAIF